MGKVKEEIQKVYDECTKLYEEGGVGAVCDHVIKQQGLDNAMYDDVKYRYCNGCEAGQPNLNDVCLVCGTSTIPMSNTGIKDALGNVLRLGDTLHTVGDLRELMSDLDDSDQICIEAIDLETGDTQDLYPLALDVIDGIKLTDGSIVREVRFCQRPNCEPDTRDKQPLVDEVIEQIKADISEQDVTALDELLKFLPWEILKNYLPEDRWAEFNGIPEETYAPENFSMVEIEDFKDEWGQFHDEICAELNVPDSNDADDILMGDYFWLATDNKWFPKCASTYSEREQAIANYLRTN